MNETTHLKIGDINKNLICILCGGYYIDATTIIECLHSFCRTCIVTYLKTSKTCPVCDTVVHKTRPHQNIRSDKLLQDLVYKIVPGLYKDEMRRRREFYTRHYDVAPKRPGEERGDEMSDRFAYTEEEKISLALHFCREGASERMDFRRVFTSKEDVKTRVEKRIKGAVDVRYLQCKAAVTIGHLKKYVRLKYGLPSHFQVDMFYNEEPLRNSCTLCDVAYFFIWRRRAPLMLTFCVHESTRKRQSRKVSSLTTNATSIKSEFITDTVTPDFSAPPVITLKEPSGTKLSSISPVPSAAASVAHPTPSVDCGISSQPSKTKPSRPRGSTKRSKSRSATLELSVSPLHISGSSSPHVMTKLACLGKRPATCPVPIAPAAAKIAITHPHVVAISRLIKLDSKPQANGPNISSSPKLVSLLPARTPPAARPDTSPSVAPEKTPSTKSFSVASLLNLDTGTSRSVSCSSRTKPAVLTFTNSHTSCSTFVTSAGPTFPSYLSSPPAPSSSRQAASSNPKSLVLIKTSLQAHNQTSKQLQAASLSSAQLSSSPLPPSSSATMTVTQSSHNNSIGSPTPAASASPTPAAVPIQQSQTQGSDMLQAHPNLGCVTDEAAQPIPVQTHMTSPTYQGGVCQQALDPTRQHNIELDNTYTNSQSQSTPKAANSSHSQTNIHPKSIPDTHSVTSSSVTTPSSLDSSFSSSFASATSGDASLTNRVISPAASPTSHGSNASCTMRKQTKQKKIADIANTLHKRVSDALLNMVTKRSNSPSNRRQPQLTPQGEKAPNSSPAASDLREATSSTLGRHSLQNFSHNGHLFGTATPSQTTKNGQNDEPLNLVKRDKTAVRLAAGIFILEVPQSLK